MPPKRKGLGRGLDALIPNKLNAASGKENAVPGESSVKKTATGSIAKKKELKEENFDIVKDTSDIIDKDSENISASDSQIKESIDTQNIQITEEKTESNDTSVDETPDVVIIDKENSMDDSGNLELNESSYNKKKLSSISGNEEEAEKVLSVRISLVEPNREQPRKKFNEEGIEELSASIKQYGVIQPLLVQWKGDYYEIIAGERRWRAAMKAGLKEIPVIVKEYSNKEAVEISLIENIQREDLNPIEEALAYERLVEEFEMTQEQVAERVSKSRSAIANSMRLLKLEGEIRELVISGDISEGHARTLLALPSFEAQSLIADRIVKEKLSVRDTEKLVKKLVSDVKRPVRKRDYEKEAILGNLSEQLKSIFGTKVSISENSKHRGKIEIEYYSDDELNRIFELLQSIR